MRSFIFAIFTILLTCEVSGFYTTMCRDAESSTDELVRFVENMNCTLLAKGKRFRQHLIEFHNIFKQKIEHWRKTFADPAVQDYLPPQDEMPAQDDLPDQDDLAIEDNLPVQPVEDEVPFEDQLPVEGEVPIEDEMPAQNELPFQNELPAKDIQQTTTVRPVTFNIKPTMKPIEHTDSESPILPPTNEYDAEVPIEKPAVSKDFVYPDSMSSMPGYEGLDHPIDIRMARVRDFFRWRREANDDSQSEHQGNNK